MLTKKLTKKIAYIFAFLSCISCKKQNNWLDIKNDKSKVVPQTLVDFQAILDNTLTFNYNIHAPAGLVGSDDIVLSDADYTSLSESERNLFIWNKNVWGTENSTVWRNEFRVIECSNLVLEGLAKINSSDNNIIGQALFHRAIANYTLLQLFCKPFNPLSAKSDLGLPLRLTSDVSIIYQRSSVSDSYAQIIRDALEATLLLPKVQTYKERPTSTSAFALLAKIYFLMGDYVKAETYASNVLTIAPPLLDYNSAALVSTTSTYRFPFHGVDNPEVLFFSYGSFTPVSPTSVNPSYVDPELYQSYESNDLRKSLFYVAAGNGFKYRGTYAGDNGNFTGIATNEIYLIRAECLARIGNTIAAMADLNSLLVKRYKSNTFTALTASTSDNALAVILRERRKELAFVGNIRWEDLRRLNLDSRFQKTLTRLINGITYTLIPNDKRYVLPIADIEIQLSGIQQNE